MRIGTSRKKQSSSGFTLIELLVVVLIIGILAAIAVPQYFKVVEKGKVSEALSIADIVRGGEERYLSQQGVYCAGVAFATCTTYDVQIPVLKYFTVGAPAAGATAPSWSFVLTRAAPTPAVYGAYTITYDVEPGNMPSVTCSVASCESDLMPH